MSDCEIAKVDDSFVNVFFFKMLFLVYIMRWRTFKIIHLQKKIYYNETFALTFSLLNPFQEDQVDVYIEFMDEESNRFFLFNIFILRLNQKIKGGIMHV